MAQAQNFQGYVQPKPPRPTFARYPRNYQGAVPGPNFQGALPRGPSVPGYPPGLVRQPATQRQGLANPPATLYQGAGSKAPKPPKKPPTEPIHEPLPLDPQYMQDTAGATRTLTDTLTDLGVRKTRTISDYGYNPDDTPNYSDPFSRQALLKQAFDARRAANTNTMAARGQLYAGALQNAQNTAQRGFLQNTDTTLKALHDALYGFGREESAARKVYGTAMDAAMRARVARALANRPTAPGLGGKKTTYKGPKGPARGLAKWQGVTRNMAHLQGWTGRTRNIPGSRADRKAKQQKQRNRPPSGAAGNQGVRQSY